jgi:two-component system NtrC family response regulator
MDVLLIDDDVNLNRVLSHQLEKQEYGVSSVTSGEEALKLIESSRFDVVITDIQMPGLSGIDLLKAIRKKDKEVVTIIITAYGTVEGALEACRLGANDYLTKPFSQEQLAFAIEKAVRLNQLELENTALRSEFYSKYAFEHMIARSTEMRGVIGKAAQVAQSDASVLITGESGTGKELLAKGIHLNSKRRQKPFITVNCPSIPSTLLESELFGHVKGAFTGAISDRPGKFEQANGGTLFLDEIGDLELQLQSKLLRFLQDQTFERVGSNKEIEVNVRVIAATNRNLDQLLKEGKFREDLYYRLHVVPIHMPLLRDHADDIPFLINHFLQKAVPSRSIDISKKALSSLQNYSWPGNIRELENTISHILVFLKSNRISYGDLPASLIRTSQPEQTNQILPLAESERIIIKNALQQTKGNKSRAARLLDIPRHVLLYRLKKLNISI